MSRASAQMPFVRLVGASCLAAALLWACGPDGEQAGAPRLKTLRLCYNPYLTYAPLFVARDEGFFAEQGIALEFVRLQQSQYGLPALTAGQVEVLCGPMSAGVLNAIARGADIKMVADRGYIRPGSCSTSAVFARRDLVEGGLLEDREHIKDLVFCCSRDTVTAYLMDKLLARFDLALRDLKRVYLPPAAYAEALEQGTVDLVMAPEPWGTRLLKAGHSVLWVADQGVAPDGQLAYMAFGPALLERDPELGRAFIVAYLKGVRQLKEGKTERNVEILTRSTGLDREIVMDACWSAFREDGRLNVKSVLDFQAWAVGAGLVDTPVSPEQFWDPSFVDQANHVLNAAE